MYKISDEVKVYRENHWNLESRIDSRRKKLNLGKDLERYIPRKCAITLLFMITMMPLSRILRKCTGRYKLSKSKEKTLDATTPSLSEPGSNGNKEVLRSPQMLQHYWSLTVRLFNVISRTLVDGGVLLLCIDAVDIFCCSSRLGQWRKEQNYQIPPPKKNQNARRKGNLQLFGNIGSR